MSCRLATALLLLLGCGTQPRHASLPEPLQGVGVVQLEDVLRAPLGPHLLALAGMDDVGLPGAVRTLHGSTACSSLSPLPLIVLPTWQGAPRVGRQWTCEFVSSACPVPPEPDWLAWIVVSTREPDEHVPLDFSRFGAPGCWLLINPDQLVSVPPGFEASPGAMLTRAAARGAITFRWTPEVGMAGQRVWMQFLVASPRGFLSSYAIELTVGS